MDKRISLALKTGSVVMGLLLATCCLWVGIQGWRSGSHAVDWDVVRDKLESHGLPASKPISAAELHQGIVALGAETWRDVLPSSWPKQPTDSRMMKRWLRRISRGDSNVRALVSIHGAPEAVCQTADAWYEALLRMQSSEDMASLPNDVDRAAFKQWIREAARWPEELPTRTAYLYSFLGTFSLSERLPGGTVLYAIWVDDQGEILSRWVYYDWRIRDMTIEPEEQQGDDPAKNSDSNAR